MPKRKLTNKYYFSVEGETEQWYLYWLRDLINSSDEATRKVAIDCKIEKSPLRRVKRMNITGKTEIWHLSDYESSDPFHVRQFQDTISEMKDARKIGKNIVYKFGYSNFTFDLWMILHKIDCNGSKAARSQYLTPINRAYNAQFLSMDEYKHEKHFHSCLNQLSIENVIDAINRAKRIMKANEENGYILQKYKGYSYYNENPSLMIWEIIEKILQDCGLI